MVFLKLTRNQWIAVAVLAVVALVSSMIFTTWWEGEAIEVSVENAGTKPIFAYLDSGRHGRNMPVQTLQTMDGKQTPTGLLIRSTQTRSFGTAVGLGDSPTLHVLAVNDDSRADSALVNDCTFDTVSLKKLEIPERHIKLRWNGKTCEVLRQVGS